MTKQSKPSSPRDSKKSGPLESAVELLESLLNEALSEESGASSGLSKSEEWLAESQYLLSLWNKAIEELEIIEVTLGDKYDANEVFDELNLQGQGAERPDLIRNFIFGVFGDDAEGALDFYDNQWLDFERGFLRFKAFMTSRI